MTNFIYDVLENLHKSGLDFSKLTFVLPSKRAGIFLNKELTKFIETPIFSPETISTEEFVEDLAQLKLLSNTELLFEFYTIYLELTPKTLQDNFDVFVKWGQIILQDFNEIDRYLIPQETIFEYISSIQEINHWSLDTNKTTLIENYLQFWRNLPKYYNSLTERLKSQKKGYQGLIYREAVNKLPPYVNNNQDKQFVFIGFNALNTAEKIIIETLLKNNLASIYWDIDKTFIDDSIHDAGYFARQHKNTWTHFETHPFNWITNHYAKEKNITIYGVPKQIGQAKTIGSILQNNYLNKSNSTAVILGDENLLIPVLNSIPKNVDIVNVTMGTPLKSTSLASLFENIFAFKKQNKKRFYYKDVLAILSHEYIRPLLNTNGDDLVAAQINYIKKKNVTYINLNKLYAFFPEHKDILTIIFESWQNNTTKAIQSCGQLIHYIKTYLRINKDKNLLALEYLYRFNTLFNELERLNSTYNHITTMSTLHSIYKELLSSETLDFKGEPLQGLQIMGMLESRVLDFENVIITSVNEGILPSGKTNNSFIPFNVKLENKLPTYKEKDAIYTYHFYRLLQRAKNIHILYNTEVDALKGGEKSRFINQLEQEGTHTITHKIITTDAPIFENKLLEIQKTTDVINSLKQIAEKGFSPSSLTNYIRNPIDFYNQKLLGVYEQEDVEETIAANTFGTVIHNTLEQLYTPLIGNTLTVNNIKALQQQAPMLVTKEFESNYKKEDVTNGYNLIALEVAKRYISNFLNYEIADIKKGNTITIIALEKKENITLPIPELDFKVNLTGTVDRIDNYNGTTRIIDYKTGKIEQNKVEVVNWEDITTDYTKYSKSFQILTYVYLLNAKQEFTTPVEAGVISFKNLNNGFLKFSKKDKSGAYAKKDTFISQDTLDNFFEELKKLVLEIMNPEINFIEKELKPNTF